jgi:hypothetical protein
MMNNTNFAPDESPTLEVGQLLHLGLEWTTVDIQNGCPIQPDREMRRLREASKSQGTAEPVVLRYQSTSPNDRNHLA